MTATAPAITDNEKIVLVRITDLTNRGDFISIEHIKDELSMPDDEFEFAFSGLQSIGLIAESVEWGDE